MDLSRKKERESAIFRVSEFLFSFLFFFFSEVSNIGEKNDFAL